MPKKRQLARRPSKPAVVEMGPVAGPVARTAAQGITGAFLVQGFEVWNLHSFTPEQHGWTVAALTIALATVQNAVEHWRGRRLIGVRAR